MWSVTLAALVLTKLLGCRKHVCMNYVISEQAMAIAPQDLFSANQIIHLRPLTGYRVFGRFVKANAFVRDFYPNFELDVVPKPQAHSPKPQVPSLKPSIERVLSLGPAQFAERLARALYGWHLRRRSARPASREHVRLEPECLKLHTSSHRDDVVKRFETACASATAAAATNAKALKYSLRDFRCQPHINKRHRSAVPSRGKRTVENTVSAVLPIKYRGFPGFPRHGTCSSEGYGIQQAGLCGFGSRVPGGSRRRLVLRRPAEPVGRGHYIGTTRSRAVGAGCARRTSRTCYRIRRRDFAGARAAGSPGRAAARGVASGVAHQHAEPPR